MADKKRLTEQDLAVLIDNEMRQSFGYGDGKLEQQRRRAMYYFMAEAKEELAPPEIDGRSRVVDTTVRNTVLGMEGPLLKTFYGSDNVFEFEETKPGDEPKAKLISAYVNHIFRNSNPGYQIAATWIREALTIKKGIIKVWWDNSDVETREEYTGQTIEQVTLLLDDHEVEIVEQKAYEDEDAARQKEKALEQAQQQLSQMAQAAQTDPQAAQAYQQAAQQFAAMQAQPVPELYDVVVKRVKTGGRVRIENVPPEEFLISKKAKSIKDSPFVAHRFKRTIAQLEQAGYTLPDTLPSDDAGAEQSLERTQRMEWVDDDVASTFVDNATPDESMREVWVVESYVQVDFDGDGIPEWRKVVKCGAEVLENVEFDAPPFVDLGSIPMPHQFYGLCPADLAIEHQKIKTSLTRAQLDNIYLQVNGRYFAVKGRVNLDDLLSSRPGGVVRVDGPGDVGRLDQGIGDTAGAMALMDRFQIESEEATGWTRQTQGGNGNQLQQTATQANIITNRADMRVESISRFMAETGWSELGYMILKLVSKYQRKAEMVKIGGEWVNVDPREWTNHFALNINVGLGTGNKDQLVNHLMMLGQKQVEALQIGYATPENAFKLSARLTNALGFKNGDEFFTDPSKMPPKQPQQDPAIVKAQLQDQQHQRDVQLKAQQAQLDAQAKQEQAAMEAQLKQYEVQVQSEAQMQTDRARQEVEAQMHALKVQYESELAQLKESNRMQERAQELEFQRWKTEQEINSRIVIAQITAKQKGDAALAAAEDEANKDMADDDGDA
jgi:hypothetical protein